MNILSYIKRIIYNNPSTSKALYCGVMYSLSDMVTQIFIQKKKFNWDRNMQFLILGVFWLGPITEAFYCFILPKLAARYFANVSKPKKVFYQLFIDNVIFAPLGYIGYYGLQNLLFKKDKKTTLEFEIKQKFLPILLMDWAIWTPVNSINFWYISSNYQSLFFGTFNFFFSVLFSYISQKELEYEEQQKKGIKHKAHDLEYQLIHNISIKSKQEKNQVSQQQSQQQKQRR